MKPYALFSAATLVAATVATAADAPKPIYVPVVLAYMNGDFVNISMVAAPMDDLHECIEKLQKLINGAQTHGEVPPGGSVIGACVPAPREYITAPVT